jgi:hypothetical protein
MSKAITAREPSHLILTLRGQRIIIDADLAALYGVSTRVLNQALKRNAQRFPETFAFQLSAQEKAEVITICDHLQKLKFSPSLPWAFTEHGALMAATMLNSPTAIRMSVEIINAFVRLRQMALSVEELARKINALEGKYDGQFKTVFNALRQLLTPPAVPSKKMGFNAD